MNDKWFNIAMIIVFTSLVANGFIFMLTSFPNGGAYSGLHQSDLDYSVVNTGYTSQYDSGEKITDARNDTYTPITLLTGDPFGLAPLNLLITGFMGLELLILQLSIIFPMFAVLCYMFILIMLTVKVVMIAYFASILIRFIFGGRQ